MNLENELTSRYKRLSDRFNRNGKDMRLSKREGRELNRQAYERMDNYTPELKQRLKEYEERVKNS
jgi:predicted nucleotide-binding protein (sugar kinase/HSP70/actin superfamily)